MMMPASRRLALGLGAAATALLCVGLTPAAAHKKLDSFSGSCSLQGTVHFTPPATNTQQPLTAAYDADGTCSGNLNGRDLSNAPVRLHQVVQEVDGSCLRADTTQPGRGAISFADGTTIRYAFEFHFVATEGTFTFNGQRSGTAQGRGSFLTQRTPPDVALQCAGEGASDAPMDMSLTTDSPLVSGRGGR
jgi:hypothetical protein